MTKVKVGLGCLLELLKKDPIVKIVSELPPKETAELNFIYLVPKDNAGQDKRAYVLRPDRSGYDAIDLSPQVIDVVGEGLITVKKEVHNENGDVTFTVTTSPSFQAVLDSLTAKDKELDTKVSALEAKDAVHEAKLSAIEAKDSEQDTKLEALKAHDDQVDDALEAVGKTIEKTVDLIDAKVLELKKDNERQDGALDDLGESVKDLNESVQHLDEEHGKAIADLQKDSQGLKELTSELDNSINEINDQLKLLDGGLEEEVKAIHTEVGDITNAVTEIENRTDKLAKDAEDKAKAQTEKDGSQDAEIEALKKKDAEVETALETLGETLGKTVDLIDHKAEGLDTRVKALESKEDSDKQTLAIAGNKLSISNGNEVDLPQYDDTELNNALDDLEDKLDDVRDELAESKDNIKQANDYTEQVKNYLEGKVNANKDAIDANKADADAKNTALTTRVNVLEEAKPVVENKLTEIEAKNTAQDEKITALENRTDNFINNVAVTKADGKVKLTYSRVDGSSSEVEFEDSDTVTLAYDDEPLKTRIKALEDKEDKDTIYNDTEVKQGIKANENAIQGVENDLTALRTHTDARLEALENKEDKDTIYDDSAVRGQITALEGKVDGNKSAQDGKNTELENRIQALEVKPDKDTVYDDTALVGRVTALETTVPANKEAQDAKNAELDAKDKEIEGKITALENKVDNDNQTLTLEDNTLSISGGNAVTLPKYDDSALKASVEELKAKDTELANKDQELTNEINTLKAKTDNFVSGVSVNKEGNKVKLTYSYVDGSNKEVEFEDSDTVTLAYDDTAVKERLTALEAKEDKDTIYDDSALKAKVSDLTDKDTALDARISALETKPDKDTVYDDTALKAKVDALSNRVTTDESAQTIKDEAQDNEIQALKAKDAELAKSIADNKADADTKVQGLDTRLQAIEAKEDNDKQTLSLTDHTLAISNGNSVELPKYDDSALKAKDAEQDEAIKSLKEKTKSFLTGAGVTRQGNVVTLTYTNIDGSSTNLEFNDNDTKAIAYDDSALKARVQDLENRADNDTIYNDAPIKERITALENKPDKDTVYDDAPLKERLTALETKVDKDTVYDDSAVRQLIQANKDSIATTDNMVDEHENKINTLTTDVEALKAKPDKDTIYDDSAVTARLTALETKEDKDTVYNDEELRNKITALEGKTDNFVSNVGVSREGNTVKLTYTMVNGDNKEVSFTDNDTVSVAYDDSALRGRVEALENKPEVGYELVKATKAVTPSQGEGVINLASEATTDPLKELVLTGNVSAKVKSPFGGEETTVAGKVGFNSGTTGDAISGSHTTAVSENVYVEFYYTDSTVKAYLVYEPDNENEVVKYRKALSLAELQGTEPARISISKANVEQGYVEATFTAVTASSNSYKVQKKG